MVRSNVENTSKISRTHQFFYSEAALSEPINSEKFDENFYTNTNEKRFGKIFQPEHRKENCVGRCDFIQWGLTDDRKKFSIFSMKKPIR